MQKFWLISISLYIAVWGCITFFIWDPELFQQSSIKYELDCTVSDFTNKYNALLLKDESLTWYYNYENKKTKIADLSADTTGVWNVEISLPEERIVAICNLYEKDGKPILFFNRIEQWYLTWNIGGNQGRSSKVLDEMYMFISDAIRISNTFERSFLDKLCNYKSPRKTIAIIANFWTFYTIPLFAGYVFVLFLFLFFIKRKFRNLGTLSILLVLISFFPVFIYKSPSFDYGYCVNFDSTTDWWLSGFVYVLRGYPLGLAWLCNLAYLHLFLRMSLGLRKVDLLIYCAGLLLAIYPIINHGSVTDVLNWKEVSSVTSLGPGYFIWLAGIAIMFVYTLQQHLISTKMQHTSIENKEESTAENKTE